ncbi:MAG: prepilin-type N-terminal cleavage/methylation domain-containing protein [Planctomycetes bacterium]|nr:prepilin-type N-terminal cleavage/methylation domain-containing protein [Planctomycetota bacterium]
MQTTYPSSLGSGEHGGGTRRGFSYVELVIVVAILGVVSLMAAPRYASAMACQRLDAAAWRLASDIGVVRATARAKGTNVSIDFDVASASYSAPLVLGLDRRGSTLSASLGGEPYLVSIKTADFGGAARLVFNGYGAPVAAGSVVLRGDAGVRTITVAAVTGSVSVK